MQSNEVRGKMWRSGEPHQRGGNQPENYQLVEGDIFIGLGVTTHKMSA